MKNRDIAVVVSNANKDVSAIETIDAIRNAENALVKYTKIILPLK